jgi:hypothetical protein
LKSEGKASGNQARELAGALLLFSWFNWYLGRKDDKAGNLVKKWSGDEEYLCTHFLEMSEGLVEAQAHDATLPAPGLHVRL